MDARPDLAAKADVREPLKESYVEEEWRRTSCWKSDRNGERMSIQHRTASLIGMMVLVGSGLSAQGHAGDHCADELPGASADRCEAWVALHGSPPDSAEGNLFAEFANDLVVASDGDRVFVTGLARNQHGGDPLEIWRNTDAVTLAYDATDGRQLWVASLDLGGYEEAYVVAAGGDTVAVAARAEDVAGENDIVTVAYDAATGAERWRARLKGTVDLADLPADIAFSAAGDRVFVTGQLFGPASEDYGTVAYDATTGEELWLSVYGGPACASRNHALDQPRALAVGTTAGAGSEAVFVTGRSGGCGTALDMATVAYEAATGALLWEARHHLGINDEGTDVAISGDGIVLVAGTGQAADRTDAVTTAYDASSGELLWEDRYDGPAVGNHDDSGVAVVSSGDSAIVAVRGGLPEDPVLGPLGDCSDIVLVSYDRSSGTRSWTTSYDGPGGASIGCSRADEPVGLANGTGGTIFVSANVAGAAMRESVTIAVDAASGAIGWVALYDGPQHLGAFASSIAANAAGSRVFVAGGASVFGDYMTAAYDA